MKLHKNNEEVHEDRAAPPSRMLYFFEHAQTQRRDAVLPIVALLDAEQKRQKEENRRNGENN